MELEAGGAVEWKDMRDALIVGVALLLLVFEVTHGGGRAPVLTCLSGLLLSPLALRIDAARRDRRDDDPEGRR